jgi:hypothetical protein
MNPIETSAATAAVKGAPRLTKEQLLGAVGQLIDLDYLCNGTNVGPSNEAQTSIELLNRLRMIEERLDLAWVGAAIAGIFLKHPWLEAVDLEVSAESPYDDAGSSFISVGLRFTNLVAVAGARLPDSVAGEAGAFDEDAASELLGNEHEDDAFNFAQPFLLPNVVDATTLSLRRETFAAELSQGVASGIAVARCLWPDHEVVRRLDVQASA